MGKTLFRQCLVKKGEHFMPRQKASSFYSLTVIILVAITFMLFPLQSKSGDIYTYTDEKGVTVITNTPLPDDVADKAKKIESYKNAKDETMMHPDTDIKGKAEKAPDKISSKTAVKDGTEAELYEKMKKTDVERDKFVRSVNESKKKAADVLTTLQPLRKFP
jgi:hypothetical protein